MAGEPTTGAGEGHAEAFARACLEWSDRWWDEARGLLRSSPGMAQVDGRDVPVHLVPQTAWYAVGLLWRAGPGDADRAIRAIRSVIATQYDEPGTPLHGTYARFGDWPHPGPDPEMWVDYDPNWRQFVGTTFLLALDRLGDRIPAELAAEMLASVRLAVAGEDPRRVPPSYTNIALKRSWLDVAIGERDSRPELVEQGEALAAAVVERFDRNGAFDEYNSPTYYGVDLFALALWRDLSGSVLLRREGPRLEATLWRDIARWYHAGLGNLCGPFTRAYGMDMRTYVAHLVPWIWQRVGPVHTPIPPFGPDDVPEHGWDLHFGPLTVLLRTEVPDDVVPHLTGFRGERTVEQRISRSRRATGWLAERVMAGGEQADDDLSWWEQYHAATVHWRLPDGGVGWILGRVPGPSDAVAQPGRLTIRWSPAAVADGQPARFVVHAPATGADAVGASGWTLPGLRVGVDAPGLGVPAVRVGRDRLGIAWEPPTGGGDVTIRLHLDPT